MKGERMQTQEEERVRNVTAAILFPWAREALELLAIVRTEYACAVNLRRAQYPEEPGGLAHYDTASKERLIASIDRILTQASR